MWYLRRTNKSSNWKNTCCVKTTSTDEPSATSGWITQESQRLLVDIKGWKEAKGFVTYVTTIELEMSFISCLSAKISTLWIADKSTYQGLIQSNHLFGRWYCCFKLTKQKLSVNWELSWAMSCPFSSKVIIIILYTYVFCFKCYVRKLYIVFVCKCIAYNESVLHTMDHGRE